MPALEHTPFSYRDDPAVPQFDDRRALFVFDGVCVLCSTGARTLMRADRHRRVAFTSVQSPLGAALYRHFGVDPDETYLLVAHGRAWTASRGYLELARILGGPWHLLRLGGLLPERLRDAAYFWVARRRYRLFGRTQHCALLTPDQRSRLL